MSYSDIEADGGIARTGVERHGCVEPDRPQSGDVAHAAAAADAQIILTSPELVDRIGKTNADVIVVQNYFDLDELEQKLDEALG